MTMSENIQPIMSEKTVVLLSTAIDVRTALNVTGHLALSLSATVGSRLFVSRGYVDASGSSHGAMSAWPFITLKTRPSKLAAALAAAREHADLIVVDYPTEVLSTKTDEELKKAIAAKVAEDFAYLGIIAHGRVDAIDSVFGRFGLVQHAECPGL